MTERGAEEECQTRFLSLRIVFKLACYRESAVRLNLNSCRLHPQQDTHTHARAHTHTHTLTHTRPPLLQVCVRSWEILHANVSGFVFIIKLQMF